MTYPHRPATPADLTPSSPGSTWTVRRKAPAPRSAPQLRRYEISWLDEAGQEQDMTRSAPAIPIFEEAFGAFARGTLIPTATGPVAIEDLRPGAMIETTTGEHLPLRWIGTMTIIPNAIRPDCPPDQLYRIAADSFGFGRPAPDLVLGPHARYLMRGDNLKSYLGATAALAPVSSLADGMNVIEVTPISAVPCFHMALDGHHLIRANGVELETYHPGANTASRLMGDLRGQFLGLFPHIQEMADFGPMRFPRLSAGDLLQLNAA